jgi:Leucine-rich repeat (LRR) protein
MHHSALVTHVQRIDFELVFHFNLRRHIKVLFLQDNDMTKLEGLEELHNLEELVLDRNRIKFIDPSSFVGLVNLRELRMEENGLRSLSHLAPLVRQGLGFVHSSAQLKPSFVTEPLTYPSDFPQNMLKLSRKLNECKPLW